MTATRIDGVVSMTATATARDEDDEGSRLAQNDGGRVERVFESMPPVGQTLSRTPPERGREPSAL